jgi:hypothetical protein
VLILAAVLVLTAAVTSVAAATIFESGTLGPTGITWEQVTNQETLAVNVSSAVFGGVRFQLSTPVVTTQIGGHFVGRPDADHSFFGAIVELDGNGDFPDSVDLSTSDVRGVTLLTFPSVSAEVSSQLNVLLEPGWYALVFGSGLFNATGAGASLRNNMDIGMPDYIGFQMGFGWGERATQDGKRFVVLGNVVPEPISTVHTIWAVVLLFGRGISADRRSSNEARAALKA